MGMVWPPPPLSQEEFDRRVAAGAKTFEEIDPEFCKWNQERVRAHIFQAICLGAGVFLMIVTFAIVMLRRG